MSDDYTAPPFDPETIRPDISAWADPSILVGAKPTMYHWANLAGTGADWEKGINADLAARLAATKVFDPNAKVDTRWVANTSGGDAPNNAGPGKWETYLNYDSSKLPKMGGDKVSPEGRQWLINFSDLKKDASAADLQAAAKKAGLVNPSMMMYDPAYGWLTDKRNTRDYQRQDQGSTKILNTYGPMAVMALASMGASIPLSAQLATGAFRGLANGQNLGGIAKNVGMGLASSALGNYIGGGLQSTGIPKWLSSGLANTALSMGKNLVYPSATLTRNITPAAPGNRLSYFGG